jgi:tight adherence protein C
MYWLIAALSLAAGAGLLLVLIRQQESKDARQRFREVLDARGEPIWLLPSGTEAGARRGDLLKRVVGGANEMTEVNLRRAGWTSSFRRTAYYTGAVLAPVFGMVIGAILGTAAGKPGAGIFAYAFIGFGIGFFLPAKVLAAQAKRRQRRMSEEMLAVLHLLRMLFDAGLSLEHALRVISEQGRHLVPDLAGEFAVALARINNGQERGEALDEMAGPLDVPELDDTVAILKQVTRYGGSLRDSLARLATLIEERRMLGLREKVNKLSGKMSMVMMVFLFPALMLFLAGPGFLALTQALTRMK